MGFYQGTGRSAAFAMNAMCATSHPLAAQAALTIIREGGNAVDAAVAGAVVLGFCEPAMTGLGGDVFAMVREPGSGRIHGLNGSGRAPAALHAEMLRGQGYEAVPLESAHSVAVPGAVDAFERLLRHFGTRDLATVLAPAIAAAENGVPVCHRSALDWGRFGHRLWGEGRRHFLRGGQNYRPGDVFSSAGQAEALRLIAAEGADAFYQGAIAQDIVDTLRKAGGLHTMEDFARTEATFIDPLRTRYRDHDLIELPPNGQGATALLLTKILSRFDLARLDPVGPDRIHLHAEATRLAYAARNRFVGDPDGDEIDLNTMLSDASVDRLADEIDMKHACTWIEARIEALHRDTVYICVSDEKGLAVSLIYSIFYPFGSGLASRRFGISLQNRGAGFSLLPGHLNELRGGKRPLHTLIPGFLELPGQYTMPFGVMGGAYQAAGHGHVVSNIVDYGMDVQQAIDTPRSFADIALGVLQIEDGVPEAAARDLAARGHQVARVPVGIGGAQAIRRDLSSGLLTGGSDQRKDGCALGY
ncbi:gamma-glutamyltransferase family protein [Paracoccus aerius]|uniref:Gamma-glutamyltransferase family protein n=1 Tax=Paracoccus aerius TaxID=1915382 RepID=A0ABS1S8H8_9RHOB|nr:gamma-glutamyltransferase family protein [Paracoccus aerius]MBL3674849.1 gamma-glutamyltransferase family protein [Paracoccus aerius]GHG29263.1 gamma-glutamyltransferase [Paracoccus aerius]